MLDKILQHSAILEEAEGHILYKTRAVTINH